MRIHGQQNVKCYRSNFVNMYFGVTDHKQRTIMKLVTVVCTWVRVCVCVGLWVVCVCAHTILRNCRSTCVSMCFCVTGPQAAHHHEAGCCGMYVRVQVCVGVGLFVVCVAGAVCMIVLGVCVEGAWVCWASASARTP